MIGEVNLKFDINDSKLYVDGQLVLEKEVFLDKLGAGANAVVFHSYNKLLKREEAIKIWKPRKGYNHVDIKRYLSEIEKNASFNNDSIARVYEAGIIDNCYYIKMEYCEGITLKEYLSNKPRYGERLYVLSNIISAMYSVYTRGDYHGDLHSKNILINNYEVKILDFGTSIFVKEKQASHKRDATMLFDLAVEILPELKEIDFFYDKVREKTSLEICECIIYLIELLCFEINDFGDNPYDFYLLNILEMAKKCDALDINDFRGKVKYKNSEKIFDYFEKKECKKNTMYVIEKNKMFLREALSKDVEKIWLIERYSMF